MMLLQNTHVFFKLNLRTIFFKEGRVVIPGILLNTIGVLYNFDIRYKFDKWMSVVLYYPKLRVTSYDMGFGILRKERSMN